MKPSTGFLALIITSMGFHKGNDLRCGQGNISGGQQLVGLARALWKNPQIILLDEATSALDRATEKFVLALLERIKQDRIIFWLLTE